MKLFILLLTNKYLYSKMCQQMAKLVKRKLRAEDKASPDNIISLEYKEDTTKEKGAPIEEPEPECKEDTIQEVTETQGNEAKITSADLSLNCVASLERDQQQGIRASTRQRRPPIKLSNDFL
jgi:hypothetical protein